MLPPASSACCVSNNNHVCQPHDILSSPQAVASRYPPLVNLPPRPPPTPFADHPLLHVLVPEVQQRIDALLSSANGILTLQHFEAGVVNRLMELDVPRQMAVVEDLLRDDISTIRNPVAYINGIIRRYVNGEPSVRGGVPHRRRPDGRPF